MDFRLGPLRLGMVLYQSWDLGPLHDVAAFADLQLKAFSPFFVPFKVPFVLCLERLVSYLEKYSGPVKCIVVTKIF